MLHKTFQQAGVVSLAAFCMLSSCIFVASAADNLSPVKFTVEPGRAWTPPFGLGRAGHPWDAVVGLLTDAKPCKLDGEYRVDVEVTLPPRGATWFVIGGSAKDKVGR